MIDQSGLLHHCAPAGENREVWNAPDVEPCRQVGMTLGVDLDHYSLAGHVLRGLADLRRSHAAGSAPCCPEVGEHRYLGLAQNLVELSRVDVQRLIGRRRSE